MGISDKIRVKGVEPRQKLKNRRKNTEMYSPPGIEGQAISARSRNQVKPQACTPIIEPNSKNFNTERQKKNPKMTVTEACSA
ncbi:MAG: hypothetical protein K8S55_05690 [Phycisphaerae bacterium]|nr:hypothetical protein [Phycisphaerae bacterium]